MARRFAQGRADLRKKQGPGKKEPGRKGRAFAVMVMVGVFGKKTPSGSSPRVNEGLIGRE